MAKRNKSIVDTLIELLIIVGGVYLVYKIFIEDDQLQKQYPSISGPPRFTRKLISIKDNNGKDLILQDMKALQANELGELVSLISTVRKATVIKAPLYKPFKDSAISGEFRKGQWRILVKRIENDFLFLSFFKKKSNETPDSQIRRAEQRLQYYKGV